MPDPISTDDMISEALNSIEDDDVTIVKDDEAPEQEQEESQEEEEESEENSEEESDDEEESEDESTEEVEDAESDDEEEEEEEKVDKDLDTLYNEWTQKPQKITVDGEEIEVTPQQALQDYQRKAASDKRFREASDMKKAAETFWDQLLDNPGEALVDRIVDEYCKGDRVKARAAVVQTLLEWMEPERQAAAIEDEKEKALFYREQALKVQQQETERQENLRLTRAEREADEEFSNNLRAELLKGFEENSLPADGKESRPLWNRAGAYLQAFKDELPSYMQDDINSMRREIIKHAREIVKQVASERDKALKDYLSTLSKDELEKRFPEEAKKQRVEKAKNKRSQKKKGNVKKKQKETSEKIDKIAKNKNKAISTTDLFEQLLNE